MSQRKEAHPPCAARAGGEDGANGADDTDGDGTDPGGTDPAGSAAGLDAANTASGHWTVASVIAYAVLAAIVFYTAQTVAAVAVVLGNTLADPAFDIQVWAQTAETDGVLLAVSTIAAAGVTVPFVRFLAGRREAEPWRFLGFEAASAATIGKWLVLLAAFIVASDALTLALGRPLVPEFMTDLHGTVNPVLLLLALVVAAPLSEEVFFRGFVMSGLQSAGVSPVAVAASSSAAWAVIHLQYDLYGVGSIFVMGLLLAAARIRTGSIWPCVAMHATANAVAAAETAFVA